MQTLNSIDRISQFLSAANLSWLLPNLRQDFVVWNGVIAPEFIDKLTQWASSQGEINPGDLCPGRLALVGLDQIRVLKEDSTNLLVGIDQQVVQTALRNLSDLEFIEPRIITLSSTGLLAVALATEFRATHSWKKLLSLIQNKPGAHWQPTLVCLYGLIDEPVDLLEALIQPNASPENIAFAVHAIISNPLRTDDQIDLLMSLCQDIYGNLIQARERLLLIRSLREQNPATADLFCSKWQKLHSEFILPNSDIIDEPIELLHRVAESLFQVEVTKYNSDKRELNELIFGVKDISEHLNINLELYYLSASIKYQQNVSINNELSKIQEHLTLPENNTLSAEERIIKQAELALVIADQGFNEQASELLPREISLLTGNPIVYYAMGKIWGKASRPDLASSAINKLIEIIEQDGVYSAIPVSGEHFSLVHLSQLLMEHRKPEYAITALKIATTACPNDISVLNLLAVNYRALHKYEEICETYRVIVALDPENIKNREAFAQALENTSEWEAAMNEHSTIINIKQNRAIAESKEDLYAYARCALNANHLDISLSICDGLLTQDNEDYKALIYTGKAYLKYCDIEKGVEYLNRATQVAPHLAEPWLALANAQKEIYPNKTVIDTLNNASKSVPDSAEILFALGEQYILDDTPSLALPELRAARALSPEDTAILYRYGQALKLLGHLDESKDVLSKAYHLDPYLAGIANLYAEVLIELGELELAIPPLESLISRKNTHNPEVYMDYARCILTLSKSGSTKYPPMKALIALNEVIQLDPGIDEARALIAETLVANGDKEIAFQAYRDALDTSLIKDKIWLERLSYGFGSLAYSLGKYDIAIAALQDAAQSNPGNPDIFKALSDAYLAAVLPEDAIRAARNVLVICGDDPSNLAWFALQASKVLDHDKTNQPSSTPSYLKSLASEGLNAITKAIQLAPTRTDLLIQLGEFHVLLGNLDDAKATFSYIAGLDFASIDDLKAAAKYLSEIGDHDAAIACLDNAISQDQTAWGNHDIVIYAYLADEYVKKNDHPTALNTLDKALDMITDSRLLVLKKVEILLELGQTIDALKFIDSVVLAQEDMMDSDDLVFLASKINRSMGNFAAAIDYAQQTVGLLCKDNSSINTMQISSENRILVAEIYRALTQEDKAYKIINPQVHISRNEFSDEQGYLDFICLHTEIALETGTQTLPDIHEIHPDTTNFNFPRVMAITSRLVSKAGNYQQAEQIYQIAANNFNNHEYNCKEITWSTPYTKYLTAVSLAEAALDLGLWDQADRYVNQLVQTAPDEPLTHLLRAKISICKAEFYHLCENVDVTIHKPAVECASKDAYMLVNSYLECAKHNLDKYPQIINQDGWQATDETIDRWHSRAIIAFNDYTEFTPDPVEKLSTHHAPGDATACIYRLHQIDMRSPERDSIAKMIKIARSYPRNPAVLIQVALAICDDNPVDAMKSLLSVLEQNLSTRNPTTAMINALLARIAFQLDQYDTAQRAIEAGIGFWQDEPEWHIHAAKVFKKLNQPNLVIDHLIKSTQISPKNAAYHLELAKEYYDYACGDPHRLKLSRQAFEKVLELEPANVEAQILLAQSLYHLNDLEQAEQSARKALILAPNRAVIYQLLSEIAIKNSDFQGAYEYANKAIQISPKDIQSTIILARSLSALGRNEEALNKLTAMVAAVPDSRLLRLERIEVIKKINGPRDGLAELRQLSVAYPNDFGILNALAKAYLEVNEPENAINIAQLALTAMAENPSHNEQADLHLMIGQVLRQTGQLDESILHLNDAIRIAPNRLEPYLELGIARKEKREYQQAIQIFEQASEIDPEDPRAVFQAGLALKETKDYKSSETMLRKAVNLAPHDLTIRRQLAAVVALNLVHNPRMGRS